ncbi:MAG: flagellar motor switch phosphatase FliY [Lachnospiraceae bacterium]|nr:flagellar motor switch phosphatase FliY [Lachnospiraceae bacterium]
MADTSLSQEEINALFAGAADASTLGGGGGGGGEDDDITSDERDTIGEVANISMGTAATTLFSLVNKRVEISTPEVSTSTWDEIMSLYAKPCVLVRIGYTKGLDGSNVLILKEDDVKCITDLMMGGDGTNLDQEIGELHLSAISEAMNQMMGSSATSLSSMLNMMVDISPPSSDLMDLNNDGEAALEIDDFLKGRFVKIEFKLLIGDLVDSKIMQLYPISLAKEMCRSVASNMETDSSSTVEDSAYDEPAPAPAAAPAPGPAPAAAQPPMPDMGMPQMDMSAMGYAQPQMAMPPMGMPMQAPQQPVNVSPAAFAPFAGAFPAPGMPENIDLIMDVPLEVTVELGRTHKTIHDILDFAPGTIIELNKIAGEPIDVLVNGKYVAKGEVVVIEESFGIRITEITK